MNEWLLGSTRMVDSAALVRLLGRFGLDLVLLALLIGPVCYRRRRSHDLALEMAVLNAMTFGLCVLLRKVPADLGFALGLFAVFGILRYRTEPLRIRALTYLFVAIGLGVCNGVANRKVSLVELLTIDVTIVGITVLLATLLPDRQEPIEMRYDNLTLVHPSRRVDLIADVAARTGLRIVDVDVVRFDLLSDAVVLRVHHEGSGGTPPSRARTSGLPH